MTPDLATQHDHPGEGAAGGGGGTGGAVGKHRWGWGEPSSVQSVPLRTGLARRSENARLNLFPASKCVKETHNFIILFLSS